MEQIYACKQEERYWCSLTEISSGKIVEACYYGGIGCNTDLGFNEDSFEPDMYVRERSSKESGGPFYEK